MSINKTEAMPLIKFAQSLKVLVHNKRKRIKGTFKNLKTGKITKGDNFEAVVLGRETAEETYKVYLKWFNHTREDVNKEAEREYVYAEWEKAKTP